ncbi:hypothetical protein HNQ59_003896 [Chitinivorax tropicus]|uniref:Putative adhesin Stv domain-containing protein n=1 Tax=Chitinivorax tropicus TaxID=714531 RepID=A0A840MT41_9PROT|nr:hypothetical protein [Chitinivorax tropicus]MBB5020575.1 hypothetical protein [Chitinivorax tropicus]
MTLGFTSDSRSSTTQSAISAGQLELRDPNRQQQDLSQLKRDTHDTAGRLDKIFDKHQVDNQLEFQRVAQEEARPYLAKASNWIGDHFAKDDPLKYLAHAGLGATLTLLTGSGWQAGAVGGALGEALPQVLDQAFEKDANGQIKHAGLFSAATQLLSAAVASQSGLNGMASALASQNAVENNYLKHQQIEQREARKKQECAAGDQACRKRIDTEYRQLDRAQQQQAEVCKTASECRKERDVIGQDIAQLEKGLAQLQHDREKDLISQSDYVAQGVSINAALNRAKGALEQNWRSFNASVPIAEWNRDEHLHTLQAATGVLSGLAGGALAAGTRTKEVRAGSEPVVSGPGPINEPQPTAGRSLPSHTVAESSLYTRNAGGEPVVVKSPAPYETVPVTVKQPVAGLGLTAAERDVILAAGKGPRVGTNGGIERSFLGSSEGHQFAAKVIPGGTGTAFVGHGYSTPYDGKIIVPQGTAITPPRDGIRITERTGQYMERGDWEGLSKLARSDERIASDINGMATYLPGSQIPNYTLTAPTLPALNIYQNSISVEFKTPLIQLLQKNIGCVQWAACTEFKSR